ncbi:hypothetical protein MY11210_001943 [Beauveria gryllotalpidicola]
MGDRRSAPPTAGPSNPLGEQRMLEPMLSRQKHWPFAPSFVGEWVNVPLDHLKAICEATYNMPPPCPIDPAIMFDLLRIRRLVDDAADGARQEQESRSSPFSRETLGSGIRARFREQACRKLSEAYRIDETICSVAMMYASNLEELSAQVVKKNPANVDAKYVHVFYEKITRNTLAASTTLEPLNQILEASHDCHTVEYLRTRAIMNAFLGKRDDAIQDLGEAIARYTYATSRPQHSEAQCEKTPDKKRPNEKVAGQPKPGETTRQRAPRRKVLEHDKPDSLLGQLLFHRGSISLQVAYHHVSNSFAPEGHGSETQGTSPADLSADVKKQIIESRKLVKRYARSAMQDFKAFLGRFQYSPDWPMEAATDFETFIDTVSPSNKPLRVPQPVPRCLPANYRLYTVSQLFEAEQIPNLPPYPPSTMVDEQLGPVTDLFGAVVDELKETSTVCESVTYHPLLQEALHALLLCHCLVQTSPTEIRRHAYMVARLARLCDGYPMLKVGHYPSRYDWDQVLTEASFLPLVATWVDLCTPKYLAAQCKLTFNVSTTIAIEEKFQEIAAANEGSDLAGMAAGNLYTEYRKTLMQMPQDIMSPEEALIRVAFQTPGSRMQQQELPDAVLNPPAGTGHAADVVRWLNETPLVRMGRKKKTRRNVVARSDPEGGEVTVVPTAGQGGPAKSETKQPEVTVVETTLPIR